MSNETVETAKDHILKRVEPKQLLGATFTSALDEVAHEFPQLWEDYLYEQRTGRPASQRVTEDPLTYGDIVKTVALRKGRFGGTMMDNFAALVHENLHHSEFYEAYRTWQTNGDGLRALGTEQIAKIDERLEEIEKREKRRKGQLS
jgi:hypothetical protein